MKTSLASNIDDVDKELIIKFGYILRTIEIIYSIDINTFKTFCEEIAGS